MKDQNLSRTIFQGDNLEVLRGINTGSVDLVYLDPPFNSKKHWNAPIGSAAAGASFKDTWSRRDIDLQWESQLEEHNPAILDVIKAAQAAGGNPTGNYMLMMAPRLVELHRVLKPSGSIYLHCDPTEGHGLKLLMDTIFGRTNFRQEIAWWRQGGRGKGSQFAPRSYGSNYDVVLFYSKTDDYIFNGSYKQLSEREMETKFPLEDEGGRYNTDNPIFRSPSAGERPNLCYTYNGVTNPHPSGWRVSKQRLIEMDEAGEVIWREGKRPLRKSYAKDYKGKETGNLWTDIPNVVGKKHTGYPTQKPVPLLERIIKSSSNKNDLIIDPFCGCATTPIAAEKLERQWIGIDFSEKAFELVQDRLEAELGVDSNLATHRTDIPPRTDLGTLPPYKDHKPLLYGNQGGHCNLCRTHLLIDHLTIDHIVPRKKGGTDHKDNLQLLCLPCNSRKGVKRWEEVKRRYWQEREGRRR